jgi:purine-nucleoside/S-methyl-5'-thioadenosine phosphorylase / adenosine deaminase
VRTLLRESGASGRSVQAVYSESADGDFSIRSSTRTRNQQQLAAGPWTWIQQVHGATVLRVDVPGQHAGAEADALVTSVPGAILSVRTADCAPVVFTSDSAVGIAHAGWKGLEAGVLEATIEQMALLGSGEISAALGACIHSCCYEFGDDDLRRLTERFGESVSATTRSGERSLDLVAAVSSTLEAHGVKLRVVEDRCTEDLQLFSHRLRQESERFVTCVWIEP